MRPDGRLIDKRQRSLFLCGAPLIPSVAESGIQKYDTILPCGGIAVKKQQKSFFNFVSFNTKPLGLDAVFVKILAVQTKGYVT